MLEMKNKSKKPVFFFQQTILKQLDIHDRKKTLPHTIYKNQFKMNYKHKCES